MKLSKNELYFIRKHRQTLNTILNKRIEDLKDEILDVLPERREILIAFIKEYRTGIGLLKEIDHDKQEEDVTGI